MNEITGLNTRKKNNNNNKTSAMETTTDLYSLKIITK